MNREQVREVIKSRATEWLTPDKSGRGYICPICGSGSGRSGTGITSADGGIHFTCWTGCYTNADIIDIIGKQHGLTDYNDKLKAAADIFGIEIDSEASPTLQKKAPTAKALLPIKKLAAVTLFIIGFKSIITAP